MNAKIRLYLTTIRDARAEQLVIAEEAVRAAQTLAASNAASADDVARAQMAYLEIKIALAIAEMELIKACY